VVQRLQPIVKGLLPHPTGIVLPLIEAEMIAEREAEGPLPTAHGTRLRASQALKCARLIGFEILHVRQTEPIPFETLMAFDVGHRFHERLQQVVLRQMGAAIEVVGYYPDEDLSCHADFVYNRQLFNPGHQNVLVKTVGEIKSSSGFGFLITTGQRKSDEGPGPRDEHVAQAALCAMAPNIDAQALHFVYIDKDRHSIAEWILPMDEPQARYQGLTPRQLAEAELERMRGILGRLDSGMLPARHVPGFGRVEHVPSPDSRDQPWQCRYCSYNSLCATISPKPTPLAELELPKYDGIRASHSGT
jgi:hypothetical protein